MRDPAVIKGSPLDEDADYIVVDPQNPLPHPQLGALERCIGLPYEEALFADEVDAEAQEYWFTEPEGELAAGLLGRGCRGMECRLDGCWRGLRLLPPPLLLLLLHTCCALR
jgi:hypothetical protein